jgi:helix-turn-helix resolvase-like protein
VSARKPSVDRQAVRQLKAQGLSADDIAEKLNVGRASVYRLLSQYQSFISIRGCEMHSNRDFPFRLWGWTKVREANIPDNIREEFELLGEDVIAMAVAGAVTTNISLNVVYQNHDKAALSPMRYQFSKGTMLQELFLLSRTCQIYVLNCGRMRSSRSFERILTATQNSRRSPVLFLQTLVSKMMSFSVSSD